MKKNLALSLFVLLSLLVGLSWSFLYWFPRLLPTAFVLTFVDEGLQAVMQSSKRGVIPQHYIALFGDSYAQGMGDWATESMQQPMARYGSAHLLLQATGRDVISFGSAGAGSVRAIVTEPVSQLAYLRRFVAQDFPDPELALVYFYEGNDLYDNAAYFHYSFPRLFDSSRQFDGQTYQQYLQQFAIERDQTWRQAQQNNWLRHIPLLAAGDKLFHLLAGLPPRQEPVDPSYDSSLDPPWIFGGASYKEPGLINRVNIAGNTVAVPDLLQGPAMTLDEQETEQAWFALDQALQFTRQHFAATRFVLVYIPSVMGSYTLASEQVTLQAYERRNTMFSRQAVEEKAQQMRGRAADIAQRHGMAFIDTTSALRAATQTRSLHGPGDWNHLNRHGYEVLSHAVADGLQPLLAGTLPVQSP